MAAVISGKVTFANGLAAQGVEVRVFDEDAPGKGDDDLTLEPDTTDSHGAFTVKYEPGRYMDFANIPLLGLRPPTAAGQAAQGIQFPDLTDIYSPYLRFRYTFNGEECTHTAKLAFFQSHYLLPDIAPLQFKPSTHGFRFANYFAGYALPFSVPVVSPRVDPHYGLCGGMSAAAYDFLLAGQDIPPTEETPKTGTLFQRYLFRRSMDSFAAGESVLQFAHWMALPDDGAKGTFALTVDEYQQIRDMLNNQQLVPLGLVYQKGKNAKEIAQYIWNNHQVLAYGYQEHADGSVDVLIYDPNEPKNDDVRLHAEKVQVAATSAGPVYGYSTVEMGKRAVTPPPVYGFFHMPYRAVEPPENL